MTGANQGIVAGLVVLLSSCGGWGGVSSSELDLSIDAAYVTQGTQDQLGSVPLVRWRDGWVRVLVTANQPNNAWPDVRVTLAGGGLPEEVLTIPAPSLVPFEASEGEMARTWNVPLSGWELEPGRTLLVELVSGGEIPDADPSNDKWPASGTPQPLDVRAAPPLEVIFVPLAAYGRDGTRRAPQISQAQLDAIVESTYALLPLSEATMSVHAEVQTEIDLRTELQPLYAAVQEASRVRALEQPSGSRVHYAAVLPLREASFPDAGGLGELDGWVLSIWDYAFAPREPTAPHELGHNFGLLHTPCTPPGVPIEDVDVWWPPDEGHENAHLGAWGMDVAAGTPIDPAGYYDLMSYCEPVWISDYSWEVALNRRATFAAAVAPAAVAGPGLLLSGRLDAAGPWLGEPALAASSAPPAPGPDAIEARDATGATLFSVPFAPSTVVDVAGGATAFAFTVPVAPEVTARLAELRWTRDGRPLVVRSVARLASPARDPATGAVVATGTGVAP